MFSGVQGADQDAKDEGFSVESKGKLSLVCFGLCFDPFFLGDSQQNRAERRNAF